MKPYTKKEAEALVTDTKAAIEFWEMVAEEVKDLTTKHLDKTNEKD